MSCVYYYLQNNNKQQHDYMQGKKEKKEKKEKKKKPKTVIVCQDWGILFIETVSNLLLELTATLEAGKEGGWLAVPVAGGDTRASWEESGSCCCLGLNTWNALFPVLPSDEKGREEEGDDRGGASGRKPALGSMFGVGEMLSSMDFGDCVQFEKAAWVWFCRGETKTGGETRGAPIVGEVEAGIFSSMGGVSFTGERMALGRGRSLDVLTVDTILTGPLLLAVLSSSMELEDSLPESLDSLPLEELELLEEDELLVLCLPPWLIFLAAAATSPAVETGMRDGTATAAVAAGEPVATWTLPTADVWGEDRAGLDKEGAMGLCKVVAPVGRRWGVRVDDVVWVVTVHSGVWGVSGDKDVMGYETTNLETELWMAPPSWWCCEEFTWRTRETVFEIFAADPPADLPEDFACRLTPAFAAGLWEVIESEDDEPVALKLAEDGEDAVPVEGSPWADLVEELALIESSDLLVLMEDVDPVTQDDIPTPFVDSRPRAPSS